MERSSAYSFSMSHCWLCPWCLPAPAGNETRTGLGGDGAGCTWIFFLCILPAAAAQIQVSFQSQLCIVSHWLLWGSFGRNCTSVTPKALGGLEVGGKDLIRGQAANLSSLLFLNWLELVRLAPLVAVIPSLLGCGRDVAQLGQHLSYSVLQQQAWVSGLHPLKQCRRGWKCCICGFQPF